MKNNLNRESIIKGWIALRLLDDYDTCRESIEDLADMYYKENIPIKNLSQFDKKLKGFIDARKQAKVTLVLKLVNDVKADKNFKGNIEINVFQDSRIDICEYINNERLIKKSIFRDCLTLKDIRNLCYENTWYYSET